MQYILTQEELDSFKQTNAKEAARVEARLELNKLKDDLADVLMTYLRGTSHFPDWTRDRILRDIRAVFSKHCIKVKPEPETFNGLHT